MEYMHDHTTDTTAVLNRAAKQRPHLTTHNDMVSPRVYRHAGDAAGAPNQFLSQGLLSQIVHSDMVLCGHKQEGLEWVEEYPYHAPPVLPEWVLCGVLGQLMYQHSLCVTCQHPQIQFKTAVT